MMIGDTGEGVLANQRGVALVVAVLIMITATFLGIAAVMTSDIEIRISGNQRCLEKAFYAADAGAERGLAWLLDQSVAAPPEKSALPTMAKTAKEIDPESHSLYRITDLNYTAPPPPGWELTLFESHYYRIDSLGNGPDNTTKEVEVMASMVFQK
jgi:Tfp pilus assembly protein PilX